MNEHKTIALGLIAIFVLGIAGIAMPNAVAATGVISLSSTTIRGNQVVQVTVTDADLTGTEDAPPRVTVDYTILMAYGNQTLSQLPMYQISGGSWVGFVTLANDTHVRSIPATPPAQDPIAPGASAGGTFDADRSDGLTEGKEPQIGTSGNLFRAKDIIAKLQGVSEGDTITFTYHDASPLSDVPVELTYTSGTTGSVSLDKTTYAPGQRAYAEISDQDMNLDPTAKDSITVGTSTNQYNYTFAGSSTTTFKQANETGPNTGIFKGYAVLESGSVSIGDIMTVTYKDGAPSGDRKASASIAANTGLISLDKSEYRVSDKGTITLTEPDLNVNKDVVDTISADTGVTTSTDYQLDKVYVYTNFQNGTRHSNGSGVKMTETGKNTGIFTGTFKFSFSSTSQANEPTILASANDKVVALYRDNVDQVGSDQNVTASATFKTFTGSISLDKSKYSVESIGILTVTDPDKNTDPSVKNSITRDTTAASKSSGYAYLYTTQDSTGSGILLIETGDNTGVFTGQFTFSSTASTSTQADSPVLAVRSGHTINALYKDDRNATGAAQDMTTTAQSETSTGTLSLDSASYTPDTNSAGQGAYVTVTVVDPDRNTSTASIDEFSASTTVGVYYRVTRGTTTVQGDTGVTMTETGANTNTFVGHFYLPASAARNDLLTVTYIDKDNSAGLSQNITQFGSIVTHTATLTASKSTYPQNGDGWVRVVDADRNIDPTVIDTIPADSTPATKTWGYFYMYSTSDPDGISLTLTETGPDTGIFEGNFTLTTGSSSGSTLKALKGATITFKYKDNEDAAGANLDIEATATLSATTGSIALDKSTYAVNSRVTITVDDPDENTSSSAIDTIANTKVTIRTTSMTSSANPVNSLSETGVNTGIFTVNFTLNQVGASAVQIKAADGDGLSVIYTEAYDATGAQDVQHTASATIAAHTATLSFDKANYETADTATVTLTDPDKDTNSDLKESYTVTVYSDTDKAGISLSVSETGTDTGIFTGTMTFSTTRSAGTQLRVSPGDTITAEITDYTVAGYNPDYPTDVKEKVQATATVGLPPTEIGAETTETSTKDSTGAPQTSFAAGETVLPTATVQNTGTADQDFLIAIQMSAPDGTVYPTNYIQTTLTSGQSFTFSPSFVLPTDAQTGTWSFEVSVFDTFPAQGGVVQADPVTQTFTVE